MNLENIRLNKISLAQKAWHITRPQSHTNDFRLGNFTETQSRSDMTENEGREKKKKKNGKHGKQMAARKSEGVGGPVGVSWRRVVDTENRQASHVPALCPGRSSRREEWPAQRAAANKGPRVLALRRAGAAGAGAGWGWLSWLAWFCTCSVYCLEVLPSSGPRPRVDTLKYTLPRTQTATACGVLAGARAPRSSGAS